MSKKDTKEKDEVKTGRPTKYKEEYPQMLLDYFSVKPYIIKNENTDYEKEKANDMPTLEGFAIKLGVSRDTLHEWSKVHQPFSDAILRAKDHQAEFMIQNGLKGLINDRFGALIAINVLNWRQKQKDEVDTIVNNNMEKMSDEDLDKALDAKLAKLGIK